MTQLTYNEAFDPYHTIFRIMRLSSACTFDTRVPFDLIRILDFYLLFPFRIQGISFFSDDTKWRAISKTYQSMAPYGGIPDDPIVFNRMLPFQRAAVGSLVNAGYIDSDGWVRDEVLFKETAIPAAMALRIAESNLKMKDIMEILCEIRDRYPLLGNDGLKKRTKLMEFRYDVV